MEHCKVKEKKKKKHLKCCIATVICNTTFIVPSAEIYPESHQIQTGHPNTNTPQLVQTKGQPP